MKKITDFENKVTNNALLKITTLLSMCIATCALVCATKAPEYRPIVVTSVTRALNTPYQPSTSRFTLVSISTTITSTLSLTGGQSGTVTLQISPDGVTYTTIETSTNNNTGTLTIGLNTSQAQSGDMSAVIPPNYYYKFVSTGTSTFSILTGQETQL